MGIALIILISCSGLIFSGVFIGKNKAELGEWIIASGVSLLLIVGLISFFVSLENREKVFLQETYPTYYKDSLLISYICSNPDAPMEDSHLAVSLALDWNERIIGARETNNSFWTKGMGSKDVAELELFDITSSLNP